MIEFQNIIFDLDGVICSTDRYHYLAWKKAVAPLGVEVDETVNNRLRGISRRASLDIILENYSGDLSEEEKEHLCEKKNNIYREMLEGMSANDLDRDVLATLIKLKGCGKKIVASGDAAAKAIVECLEKKGVVNHV